MALSVENEFLKVGENNEIFSLTTIEKDAIGEIMNISMGSSATALSTMLNRKVTITTPAVLMAKSSEFEFNNLEPAICTQIEYTNGLSGGSYMIMKQADVKKIVKLLVGDDSETDDDTLDEMHLSAIGEIMNQMMGSSSTALASFLGNNIGISIPNVFQMEEIQTNLDKMNLSEEIVIVKFLLDIEDLLNSEFISILPVEFSRELIDKALNTNNVSALNEPANKQSKEVAAPIAPEAKKEKPVPKPAPVKEQKSQPVNVKPLKLESFEQETAGNIVLGGQTSNLNLMMDVPLKITVEIGRAQKCVKDILELRQGNIVELDKQAGDPVDVIVNGQLIAKGDVVVIDDYFGVRITEIVSDSDK